MPAYYNEFDPYAAQWLRNLIAAGHLAPGDVDERSIADVQPDDLRGYAQCHFFAGIGVWGHALRSIGWADDRPIWTGSCPCQPFSAAGKQKGIADERHLWPEWYRLVAERRPAIVVGEQVASALGWLDIVQDDLENAGYAVGAADLCAAGFPVADWHESPQHEWLLRAVRHCPDPVVAEQLLDFAAFAIGNLGGHDGDHIRQRLYFVGLANGSAIGRCEERADGGRRGEGNGTQGRTARYGASGDTSRLADEPSERQYGRESAAGSARGPSFENSRAISGVEHGEQPRLEGQPRYGDESDEPGRFDPNTGRPVAETSAVNGLEYASGERRVRGRRMKRAAVLAFPDGSGEPQCRTVLDYDTGGGGGTAAWLLCNPSRADSERGDPTAGRIVHHSGRLGCTRSLVGNVWCLRTPYPADLWEALRDGRYTPEMHDANLDALAMMAAQADVFVVAFGAAPWRSHRAACLDALRVWCPDDGRVPYCLGLTPDGAPLHPLARGKFAVRNDCEIFEWPGVLEL